MIRRMRAWLAAAAAVVALLGASAPMYAAAPASYSTWLIAKMVTAEEGNRNFTDQVGVAAVVLNRLNAKGFPKTVAGVIYQPWAFTSVANGYFYNVAPSQTALQATAAALNGWDPTNGALYFFDPGPRVTNAWIYNQPVTTIIDHTVYAR